MPPPTDRGELAGFGIRLGGYLLDSLLYGLAFLPFLIVAFVLGAQSFDECVSIDDEIICPEGAPEPGLLIAAIVIGIAGLALVIVLYLRAIALTGQTWGSRIVGIKIVRRDDGMPPGWGKAIGRQLFGGVISSNVCYLGYLWMLWDANRETWHDKVAGTRVVRT